MTTNLSFSIWHPDKWHFRMSIKRTLVACTKTHMYSKITCESQFFAPSKQRLELFGTFAYFHPQEMIPLFPYGWCGGPPRATSRPYLFCKLFSVPRRSAYFYYSLQQQFLCTVQHFKLFSTHSSIKPAVPPCVFAPELIFVRVNASEISFETWPKKWVISLRVIKFSRYCSIRRKSSGLEEDKFLIAKQGLRVTDGSSNAEEDHSWNPINFPWAGKCLRNCVFTSVLFPPLGELASSEGVLWDIKWKEKLNV